MSSLRRIAQSALANIEQHKGASRVEIVVEVTGDAVVLDVVEDGVGFDPTAPTPPDRRKRFGITAMRSRARELGGSLAVGSAPGEEGH